MVTQCIRDKLQIVQNTALRIATGCTHDTNSQHLHDETNVLPIHQNLQLHASQIRQKAQHPTHPLHKLTIHTHLDSKNKPVNGSVCVVCLMVFVKKFAICLGVFAILMLKMIELLYINYTTNIDTHPDTVTQQQHQLHHQHRHTPRHSHTTTDLSKLNTNTH